MRNIIGTILLIISASQLTACGKSQATMCSELADTSLEISASAFGKLDDKTAKDMKDMSIGICMKLPEDTVKAQHKALVK